MTKLVVVYNRFLILLYILQVDIVPREERGDDGPSLGSARPLSGGPTPVTNPPSGAGNAVQSAGTCQTLFQATGGAL